MQFVLVLHRYCVFDRDALAKFAFALIDKNANGFLERNEVSQYMVSCLSRQRMTFSILHTDVGLSDSFLPHAHRKPSMEGPMQNGPNSGSTMPCECLGKVREEPRRPGSILATFAYHTSAARTTISISPYVVQAKRTRWV